MYKELGQFISSHAYTAKFAAERILAAAWKHELELWGDEGRGIVTEEGLLTQTDIERIEHEVFGPEE
jgi:hypothetical protein